MRRDHAALVVLIVAAVVLGTVVASGVLNPQSAPSGSTQPTTPPGESPPTTNPPTTNPPANSAPPVSSSGLLRVVAAAAPGAYAAGETVPVTVALTNVGTQPVTLPWNPCSLGFVVARDDFLPLYNSSFAPCAPAAANLTLAPGGSADVALAWGQILENGTQVPESSTYILEGYLWPSAPFMVLSVPTTVFIGPHADFLLEAETEAPVLVRGVSTNVTVRLRNVGTQSVRMTWSGCPLWFDVFDVGGRGVYDSLQGIMCPQVVGSTVLGPGEDLNATFAWNGRGSDGALLPPGWYSLLPFTTAYGAPIETEPMLTELVDTPRLAFSATLDQTTYVRGENATVRVILTNAGNDTISLRFPVPCMGEFLVSNETLGVVYNSSSHFGCIQVLWDLVLVPGGSYAWTFSWNLTDDGGAPLEAGRLYTVTPRFVAGWPPYQHYVVRTDVATFLIQA